MENYLGIKMLNISAGISFFATTKTLIDNNVYISLFLFIITIFILIEVGKLEKELK